VTSELTFIWYFTVSALYESSYTNIYNAVITSFDLHSKPVH
jgi:hypothetical protein